MTSPTREQIAELLTLEAKATPVRFADCPPGLFLLDSKVHLKTEYSTQVSSGKWNHDAYCGDSGEYFVGGVKSYIERDNLLVIPIDYEDFLNAHNLVRPLAEAYQRQPDVMKAAQVEALRGVREPLMDVLVHLIGAHSLLSRSPKKAAPSDKMFDQMLVDCERSIERGRAALNELDRRILALEKKP